MAEDAIAPKRRPSITDVAREAGVSKAAVSKVIRNAYGISPGMRERVEAAIDRLGYRPRVGARAMRGASFTIGFEVDRLGNDFFTQVVAGAASHLAGSGYQLIVAPGLGYLSGATVLEALADRQMDGIIAVSSDVTTDWLENLAQHVPVVLLGRHDSSLGYDTINNDDAAGVNLILDHLIELGHRRIAHLTLDAPTHLAPHAVRLAAYRHRMEEAGLEPQVIYSDSTELDAFAAARTLLESRHSPTAIFAAHDALAIGVLRAVADLELTADQVSVVGYDNVDLAGHPLISLTTIDQFGPEMGVLAIELLMERIRHGRSTPTHHQMVPQLRIRNSTRKAPVG
jgi:LacI family transcriptional regulator